jgi:hypothetical protein
MATGWRVTNQRQTTVSDGVTYVPAMIIGFQTEGGNFANVTVTADKYNPDDVNEILQGAADQIDNIGNAAAGNVPTIVPFG